MIPLPQYFICKTNPQQVTVPPCKSVDALSFAVSMFLLIIPTARYVFHPVSKQGPVSSSGACQQIHMKPINIT